MSRACSLRINEVLTAHGDDAEALVQVLHLTTSALGFDRASLVAHIEGSDHAFVIAASDAQPLARFTLAIAEYPELVEAMRTGQPLLIDDAETHPLTAGDRRDARRRAASAASRCSRCSGGAARSARSCCASGSPGCTTSGSEASSSAS